MLHPGYFAMLISIPASALAIGSWLALLPSIAFVLVIAQRTRLEDNFLRCKLPGYAEYLNNVPRRLLPIKKPTENLYVEYSA
jgi:protein-S-isoprenylcysteine O-methyltransferase Ste14